jgi:Asp-tRNA(Asn)/Glu-tRNA(Gln) amidotransferase A subunit family amidase
MARTIADVQLLFETIAGYDDGDPCSAPVLLSGANKGDDARLTGVKIGFFDNDGRTPVTQETRRAVKSAASFLSRYGFHVEAFRPDGLEESRQLWTDFFVTAGRMIIEPTLRGRESEVSPILREFMVAAAADPAHSGDSLLAAWLGRDAVREKVLRQMREYPILLCPVAAIPAFRHGERQWNVEGKTVKYLDAWSYCEWFNLLGFPAAVVPMGFSPEGLPIGVQIVGRPWQEELVLAVSAKLEEMRGAWRAPPLQD